MTNFKPMLAKEPKYDQDTGHPIVGGYPAGVQIKLDGIRASVVDGKLVSRKLKPIPNAEIRAMLERPEFEGFDGEIIVGRPEDEGCMQRTSSFVMSESKTGAEWTFYVFDKWDEPGGFTSRFSALGYDDPDVVDDLRAHSIEMLGYNTVNDAETLAQVEQAAVAQGHEGIIVRDLSAPYKFGRSGLKGPLLKIKRFIDFEAEIIGVYEEMHNGNLAKRDALGRTERSTAKAGLVGKDCLGGFELRALNGPCAGIEFRCGTGFKRDQRTLLWAVADDAGTALENTSARHLGKTVKVKSFPVGVKEAPRFPVFLGFRDLEIDG